ncbi:DDRGK domain-containing protein 1-like [Procambarus clarkii]|uniref:DDRGK domain-containing protein 1-like n=1 Tax=Procambarus clarkii TaxID=6728 RepID=UPI003742A5EB
MVKVGASTFAETKSTSRTSSESEDGGAKRETNRDPGNQESSKAPQSAGNMAGSSNSHVSGQSQSRFGTYRRDFSQCLRDTIVEGYKTNVEKAISKINLIIEDHKKLLAQREEEKAKREEEKAKREEEKAKREEEKAKREERKAKREEEKAKREERKAKREEAAKAREELAAKGI